MQHRPQPERANALLAQIGASHARYIEGSPALLRSLFPLQGKTGCREPDQYASHDFAKYISQVPLTHMLALRIAFHDIAGIIEIGLQETELLAHKPPDMSDKLVANLRSGALDLSSLYGNTQISGDLSRTLNACLSSTWDSAKLWVNAGPPYRGINGDVLRLHRITNGDGALLTEAFFEQMAEHLKPEFFANGELRLNRAIIAERRNDTTLLLSQFHFAMARFHNAVVDCEDDRYGKSSDRASTFRYAARVTTETFHRALEHDVLPVLCDPAILAQGIRQRGETAAGSALSIEGVLLLALLIDNYPWPDPASVTATLRSGADRAFCIQWPNEKDDGLPLRLFNSQRLPTRLSEVAVIDWDIELRQSARRRRVPMLLDRTRYLETLPASLLRMPVCTAGTALTHANLLNCGQSHQGATQPLLQFVMEEAQNTGQKGRLGPLGSFILVETLCGAMRHVAGSRRAQKHVPQYESSALRGLLTLQGLRE